MPSPRLEQARALARQRRWVEIVRTLSDLTDDALLELPELAVHFADALWRVGRAERSLEVARAAESVLRKADSRGLFLNVMNIRGIALFESGRVDEAGAAFRELLERATELEDDDFAARACNNLGVQASLHRQYDAALVHYERALASYTRLGQVRGIAQTHYNLGVNYRELGFFDKAESHYRLAGSYAERSGSEDMIGLAESDRGLLRVEMGDPELGLVFAARARERFRSLGDPLGEGEALRVMGIATAAMGENERALGLLGDAVSITERHPNPLLRGEVELARGRVLSKLGKVTEAQQAFGRARESFDAVGASEAAREAEAAAASL